MNIEQKSNNHLKEILKNFENYKVIDFNTACENFNSSKFNKMSASEIETGKRRLPLLVYYSDFPYITYNWDDSADIVFKIKNNGFYFEKSLITKDITFYNYNYKIVKGNCIFIPFPSNTERFIYECNK